MKLTLKAIIVILIIEFIVLLLFWWLIKMSITNCKNRGLLLIVVIVIAVFFVNNVFAINPEILGLKQSHLESIICNYSSQTNNCVLEGGDYNITGEISPETSNINLVINQDTNFNVSCVSSNSVDNNCYIMGDENRIDVVFSDFNSITIDSNVKININREHLIDTKLEFKNLDLIINGRLDITKDNNACLGEAYTNGYLYSYIPKIEVFFDKLEVGNNGILNTQIKKDYQGYDVGCGSYDSLTNLLSSIEDTDWQAGEVTNLFVDKISFNDVINNGVINLNCQTKVDNTIYKYDNCNFYFNNLAVNLPKKVINANNYGILFVSTCGPIYLPDNVDYNICKLNYIRPDTNVIDLNNANTGVAIINKVNKFCVKGSISDQISEYLFTSDSNIESRPVIFGTINSAITSQPLDVSLASDNNSGLYNTKNINQRISPISQTENIFFKLFLPNNYSTDTNLLDSYLFRFKLNSNSQVGYPEIGLDYPFKIHK